MGVLKKIIFLSAIALLLMVVFFVPNSTRAATPRAMPDGGIIAGEIIAPDSLAPGDPAKAMDIVHAIDWAEVKFLSKSGSPVGIPDRGLQKDPNGKWYFAPFRIDSGTFILLEGDYKVTFDVTSELNSCTSVSALPTSVSQCHIHGETDFTLSADNGGEVKITKSDISGVTLNTFMRLSHNATMKETAMPAISIQLSASEESPLDAAINGAITWMTKFSQTAVTTMLGWISFILTTNINQTGIYVAWKAVRTLTLSLLTLALLIIAFANIMNLDENLGYGLNRMIPKIIIAIVLSSLSYLICGALLEVTYAFQSGLYNASAVLSSSSLGTAFTSFNGADALAASFATIAEGIFLVILDLALVLATLWLTLVLIVRIAVIWILVAIAPLAFLMNIMPFTESFYKQWWKRWWTWTWMGPAIAFLLYLMSLMLASAHAQFNTAGFQGMGSWFFLIAAAVCLFMAATVPLTMGKEVYSVIDKATKGARNAAAKPVTDRYKAYQGERNKYRDLKVKKDVSKMRNWAGKQGALGQIAAGKRGVFGQDKDIARQMYLEEYKDKDVAAKEARLKELGGAKANQEDPETLAILQSIASTDHTANMSDDTKAALAKAVSAGGETDASNGLKAVAQSLEQNPDKDAATKLYEHAKRGNEKTGYAAYFDDDEVLKKSGKKLQDTAVRKATAKRFLDQSRNDILAIDDAAKAGDEEASKSIIQRVQYFNTPANEQYYVANATPKNQEDHAELGYRFNVQPKIPENTPAAERTGLVTTDMAGFAEHEKELKQDLLNTPTGTTSTSQERRKIILPNSVGSQKPQQSTKRDNTNKPRQP